MNYIYMIFDIFPFLGLLRLRMERRHMDEIRARYGPEASHGRCGLRDVHKTASRRSNLYVLHFTYHREARVIDEHEEHGRLDKAASIHSCDHSISQAYVKLRFRKIDT